MLDFVLERKFVNRLRTLFDPLDVVDDVDVVVGCI